MVIANDFNISSAKGSQSAASATMMEMFLSALPQRMKIENAIAFYSRKLQDLKSYAAAYTPSLELAA